MTFTMKINPPQTKCLCPPKQPFHEGYGTTPYDKYWVTVGRNFEETVEQKRIGDATQKAVGMYSKAAHGQTYYVVQQGDKFVGLKKLVSCSVSAAAFTSEEDAKFCAGYFVGSVVKRIKKRNKR